jgi:phytoene synthase
VSVAEDPCVAAAYRACARMQLRHDPTYFWATSFLPREVRPPVRALYGFVRGADEIVDGPRRAPDPDARRAALDDWQRELEQGLDRGGSSHPVIAALVDAGPRHQMALHTLGRYMDSMRMDCGPLRIGSRGQLDAYMEGSAATVGRLMAPLLGAPAELHEQVARLGVAFQLTNFIRDVRIDWALDRVYLPGLDVEAVAARRATPAVRAVLAREVARARDLFALTAELALALVPTMRPGVRLARAVYQRVLDRVEALEFDVLGHRAALPAWEVARALLTAGRGA